ncbi:Arginine exporter protein ArgO [Jeotgalicoccus meleagridis]|uniref:Arginine exporter protein ArgO n=1 Tax=Jeotgalicoccus meleagridis TaxID=2759181 RepID=A0A6V7R3I9_9STAP|nr:Arginine exporter protein ArgO [Jeotgalicoccus meleagridis]
MEAVIHGVILAIGLILPLGVQNVFLFTQGATQPKLRNALPATITAALCDTLLILLAIFGLSLIILQFEWLRIGIMTIGILFLIYIWGILSGNLHQLPLPKAKPCLLKSKFCSQCPFPYSIHMQYWTL